jgi:hypothetical protein
MLSGKQEAWMPQKTQMERLLGVAGIGLSLGIAQAFWFRNPQLGSMLIGLGIVALAKAILIKRGRPRA